MSPYPSLSENARGILLMLGASIGFVLNDTCVKLASSELSIGEIIIVRSVIALPVVALIALHQGAFGNLRLLTERFMGLRTLGEVGATIFYLTALARLEIANTTAIMQILPLAVTAAAALLLGEKVGVRRWSAIVVGLAAVLVIIRPGLQGFNAWSLSVVGAVGFVVVRDLSSRMLPETTHPLAVSSVSLLALIPLGLVMLPFSYWASLTQRSLLLCAASGLFLSAAYVLVTQAMRHGEISVIAPFRYAVLLMAIVIQILVFSVLPDELTIVGSAILVATGLYTFYRERKVKGGTDALASKSAALPPP